MSSNNTAEESQARTPRMADVHELGSSTNDFEHYSLQEKIEYRVINSMLDNIDAYKLYESESEEEEDNEFIYDTDGAYPMLDDYNLTDLEVEDRIRNMGPQNVFNDDSDSSDEEDMDEEDRKEMCKKGLEILETIMDKQDQRMGEGDFVELCNLLKELHRT